jgi:serine/threonine protein kinase
MTEDKETTPVLDEAPKIDNIEVLEVLGRGGMAIVFKARQKSTDRIVALKVLAKAAIQGEEAARRFRQEAQLTSGLDHPNIVKTLAFGISTDGQPYLVLEFLDGRSLADDFKLNGRMHLFEFRDVFLPVLSALATAHKASVVHRDIKPENIMLCQTDDGKETVKVLDFGIAKVLSLESTTESQHLTRTGALLGSPSYMSPEQCDGKAVDGRSDIYSISCVMYEALSGEPPFMAATSLEVMRKHSMEPPPTVSDLSRKIDVRKELAAVTLWGLAKDPAARPQTADELSRKLSSVLEKITLDKVPRLKNIATEQRLRHGLVLCFMLLCGIGGFAVWLHNQQTLALPKPDNKSFKRAGAEEQRFEKQIATYERGLGAARNLYLAVSLENLAAIREEQGKYSEAELARKRVIAIREKALGPEHHYVGKAFSDLASLYLKEAKYRDAEALLRRSLEISEKQFGPDDPDTAEALRQLGQCCAEQGNYKEAENLYKRSLTIDEKLLGPEHPDLADAITDSLQKLASICRHQGKPAEAEQFDARARSIRSRGKN